MRTYPNYIFARPVFKSNSAYISGPFDNAPYTTAIRSEMNRIYKEPIEHGVLFTRENKVLKRTSGNDNSPFKFKEEEQEFLKMAKQYPGFIFIHNHPGLDSHGHPWPINPGDAFTTANWGGSETIVVHPDGTYSSIKCKEGQKKFDFDSGINLYFATINLGSNEKYRKQFNKFGKIRDKYWKDNVEKIGVIYTCTHDFGN